MRNLLRKSRRELSKAVRKLAAPEGVRELPPEWPDDFSDFTRALCRRVAPYTMTSKERVQAVEAAVRHIVQHDLAGDIVECGVAGGGSMMAAALTLLELGRSDRTIWLYDTFAGMTEPTPEDVGRFGQPALERYRAKLKDGVSTWINIPLAQVQANFAGVAYPRERLRFVPGKVEDTLPREQPQRIALLRLDTDWYTSTKVEMQQLYPRLCPGGLIIIDDYFRWQGSRKAVDDYVAQHRVAIFWSRIDDHAVIGVKP